jgi:translocator protein
MELLMAAGTSSRIVRKWIALAVLLALVFAVSAFGSYFTLPKIPTWYAGLTKPWFNPPSWVFGPVWTVLYVLMAVAAWRIWMTPHSEDRRKALVWWGIQLVLNALWSPIFFGLEQPRWALAIIAVLFTAVAITLFRFLPLDRPAGWMLIPYLAWVCYATLLNAAIVALN